MLTVFCRRHKVEASGTGQSSQTSHRQQARHHSGCLSQCQAKEHLDRQTELDGVRRDNDPQIVVPTLLTPRQSQAGPVVHALEQTIPSPGPARPASSHAGVARHCTQISSLYGCGRKACLWPSRSAPRAPRERGQLGLSRSCAPSVTAPCARGIFGAGSGALSGADICLAFDAAMSAAGLSWCSRVGSRSKPRARGTLLRPGCPDPVSRPLRHTFLLTSPVAFVLATAASYAATAGAW